MCGATQVFCVSLVVFLLSSYTTATVTSWLSAVSFKCKGKDDTCAGALIDEHWILTTASCFQNCNGSSLRRSNAFLNISNRRTRRRGALKSGSKVSIDGVWTHPSYDATTYANNLALVKLKCHDISLDVDVDIRKANCSMPKDCTAQSNSGYLYTTNSAQLRSREISWHIHSDGIITLSRCSVVVGTDTIYYCANKPVAVSSDKPSQCAKQKQMVSAILICRHNEWITSVIQDNKAVCASSTDTPLPPSNVPVTPTLNPITVSTPSAQPLIVQPPITEAFQSVKLVTEPILVSRIAGCVLKIDNGEATVTRSLGTTFVIEYTCNTGYHISLNSNKQTRICIDGNMLVKPSPCVEITCPPFESIANGRVVVSGLTYSSVARFICDPGYYFTGAAIRSCDRDQEWSGINGFCKRKCTVPQFIRCNDGALVYPTKTAFADIGDVIQYSVPNGYELIGNNPICQPDSTWSIPPSCLKLCDEDQNIANGVVAVNRDIKSYTRKITCNEGYQPVGSDVQRCYFGTWTPIFEFCKRGCGGITLPNGRTIMTYGNLLAIFQCDRGYHLEPSLLFISCRGSRWTPSVPTCVRDY